MPTLILLIIFFVLMNTAIKLSFWKLWQLLLVGVLLGIFVYTMYPFAISKSQLQLNQQLQEKEIRQNFVAILTVETFVYMAFCFIYLTRYFEKEKKRTWLQLFLNGFPGLLIFPALFYLLMWAIFNFSGVDFSKIALYFSLLVMIGLPLLSLGLRKLFPEGDFRIEILFISGILVVVLGLISTFQGNMVYKIKQETNLTNFVLSLGGILLFAGLGIVLNKVYWQLKNKNK